MRNDEAMRELAVERFRMDLDDMPKESATVSDPDLGVALRDANDDLLALYYPQELDRDVPGWLGDPFGKVKEYWIGIVLGEGIEKEADSFRLIDEDGMVLAKYSYEELEEWAG
jgi:hypothetical protein